MPTSSLDMAALLKDLQGQVTALEDDLRRRSDEVPEYAEALHAEHRRAYRAERTAATYEKWRDERVTQVAVAWVLATVFVRFCEDNRLIGDAWLSGPGERLAEAEDRHAEYFRRHPEKNDRDWLKESFRALAATNPTVAGLFDEAHNPLWELDPGYEAASALLAFWRTRAADGEIRHDFRDEALETRFLGDLYQDLSAAARETYALLQTPVFVEEFILDLTLEPAVEFFGLDPEWRHTPGAWRGDGPTARGLRCIDPACGSGHFLLGLFARLLAKWRAAEPGTDDWTLVRRALDSVHGADKNPFAAAIARFRLLVAALKECGVGELTAAPELPINVAVGDSLLHGRGASGEEDTLLSLAEDDGGGVFLYRTEDVGEFAETVDLLGRGSYHVVVANPPYITVKDKKENDNYRRAYFACSGKYALSVPFAQCIFGLALRAGGSERNGGFTGQITSNSFMKREFGKTLIESFFHGGPYKDPRSKRKRDFGGVELTHVIDTSGAFIPGHGTPTVILAGRNQMARQSDPIRAVLGVRGEPGQPEDAARGLVWTAIAEQVGLPGSESNWVSAGDLQRDVFAKHPWSLSGGGAGDLTAAIEAAALERLDARAESLGITCFTLEDDLYLLPERAARAAKIGAEWTRPMVTGDSLRDWNGQGCDLALFPYSSTFKPVEVEEIDTLHRFMWPSRTMIANNILFGRKTKIEGGLKWSEYGRLTSSKLRTPLAITFAFVVTHNHFVLDRGGKVFNRSAPVIKLPDGATEGQHLELLGVLNSSTACFWLKQVSQAKSGADNNSGGGNRWSPEAWMKDYEFTATKLKEFPLPGTLPLILSCELDRLGQKAAAHASSAATPTRARLISARAAHDRTRARMIALQEELDWTVYGSYNLLTSAEVARTTLTESDLDAVPEVALGERAFEIVLARKVASGETDTAWFERHRSTPVTEIPTHWPTDYRQIVQARIDLIEANRNINLLERPEYKRRWSSEPWEKREAAALRAWLLDACEREELWFETRDGFRTPRTLTVSQLADALRGDEDVQSVAALYAADHLGKPDASLATVLADVTAAEHIPYLAALRYKDSGLRIRAQWERTWEMQREEDRTGERLDIPVPPRYASKDFLKQSYWSNRLKLDVPKERFISYLGAEPDADPTTLLGWAGWDHKDQAQALINLVNDRTDEDGWGADRVAPLLAGLQEVMPWVHQWHGEYDEEWEGVPAEEYQLFLTEQRTKRGLSEEDLSSWRPEKKPRGGGRRKKADSV